MTEYHSTATSIPEERKEASEGNDLLSRESVSVDLAAAQVWKRLLLKDSRVCVM